MVDKTSMYSLMDFWLQNIAPKYYDMQDTSLSNVGIFGYTNEIMAHAVESTANETSVLFNETFFNKAILPESILTYASQQNITDINAHPAIMKFAIGIREDILLNNLINDEGESYFILDKDSEIIIEDEFKYLLDYDIKINVKYKNGRYIYSGLYKMAESDEDESKILNPLSDIREKTNPYLKVTRLKNNNDYYIYVFVNARQVEKNVITKAIYKDEFIDYYNFDIDYDGTLADFYVLYKEPNAKHYIQLEKKIIDSAPTHKPFCYYQYKDDDTFSLSFSTLAKYFRPKFNSELKIVIFTTKGDKANFKYTGTNIRIVPKSEKYDYRNIILLGYHLSDSEGGLDKKTYAEIKQDVQYFASTCNNIGTTLDLNKYFDHIERESKLSFIKKRDDILERLFTCYTLFKDKNDNLMPTNTLNFKIEESEFDSFEENTQRFLLKAGSKFIYDGDERRVILKRDADVNKEKFIFTNPFSIVLSRNPFKIDYYLNSINKTELLDFYYINDNAVCNFITNNIEVKRDAINGEDEYVFTFTLIPNSDIDIELATIDDRGEFVAPTGNLVVKGVLYDDKEEITHHFNFDMIEYKNSDKTMKFMGKIKTDDYISLENFMRTLNCIYRAKSTEINKEILINASEFKLGLVVMLKEEQPLAHKYHEYLPGYDDYSITNVYKVSNDLDLINNMNKIMRSTLSINPYDVENLDLGFYYLIKEVPLIRYDYILNYVNDFLRACINVNDILREALIHLTNNFSIDFKFYNTYGKSYYFYIKGDKDNIIDRVNIDLKLIIKLNPNKLMDEIVKNNIRSFIKDYIENTNTDNNFYVSNLITKLKNTFRDIIFIEFENINEYDTSVQSIEKDFPTELIKREGLRDFVPEYVNVNKVYLNDNIVQDKIIVSFI